MRQPGNQNRKGIPRVEPITGDVNIHSVTALKRLSGVVGPSPERLHTGSWWPVQFPAPSLNDFDFEVISIHADRKTLHSFPRRGSANSARLDVEMGTVPRADHFFAYERTFRQKARHDGCGIERNATRTIASNPTTATSNGACGACMDRGP